LNRGRVEVLPHALFSYGGVPGKPFFEICGAFKFDRVAYFFYCCFKLDCCPSFFCAKHFRRNLVVVVIFVVIVVVVAVVVIVVVVAAVVVFICIVFLFGDVKYDVLNTNFWIHTIFIVDAEDPIHTAVFYLIVLKYSEKK